MFISEESRIVRRIKDFIKNENPSKLTYIMLRDGRTLYIDDYYKMVISDKITPQDAYTYIGMEWTPFKSVFYYPFLYMYYSVFLYSYLSKLGFYYDNHAIVPATGLKYIVEIEKYIVDVDIERHEDYLSIHVSDLNAAVDNTNLRKIVFEVVDGKIIGEEKRLTRDEMNKLYEILFSQRVFAGYNSTEAGNIISGYYDEGNQSQAKEVARIVMDYERIFQPYRVCYDTRTWKEVDCLLIR